MIKDSMKELEDLKESVVRLKKHLKVQVKLNNAVAIKILSCAIESSEFLIAIGEK